MDVVCIGCGDYLSWKPKERRIVVSESSKPILEVWKALIIQEVNEEEIENVDQFVEGVINDHRICRKCFYAYERFLKLQKSLEDNLQTLLVSLLLGREETDDRMSLQLDLQQNDSPSLQLLVKLLLL